MQIQKQNKQKASQIGVQHKKLINNISYFQTYNEKYVRKINCATLCEKGNGSIDFIFQFTFCFVQAAVRFKKFKVSTNF